MQLSIEDRSLSSSAVDLDHDGNVVPADSERDQAVASQTQQQIKANQRQMFVRLPLHMELGKLLVSSHARHSALHRSTVSLNRLRLERPFAYPTTRVKWRRQR